VVAVETERVFTRDQVGDGVQVDRVHGAKRRALKAQQVSLRSDTQCP
jgi:hypothetical protein